MISLCEYQRRPRIVHKKSTIAVSLPNNQILPSCLENIATIVQIAFFNFIPSRKCCTYLRLISAVELRYCLAFSRHTLLPAQYANLLYGLDSFNRMLSRRKCCLVSRAIDAPKCLIVLIEGNLPPIDLGLKNLSNRY